MGSDKAIDTAVVPESRSLETLNVTTLLSEALTTTDVMDSVVLNAIPRCSPVIMWTHNRIECFIVPDRAPKVCVCDSPLAPENVHALESLACRKRVTPASSPAAPVSRVRRSRRLRSTLAAAPGLLAHALVTQ
jgi:hypothetical protein